MAGKKKKMHNNADDSLRTHETDNEENYSARESESIRHLDKEYIKNYRQWRQDKKNSYAFFYRENSEYTYQDGKGFIRDIPEMEEKNSLYKVNSMLGKVLILTTIMNILHRYILPVVISNLTEANLSYSMGNFHGNEWAVLAYDTVGIIILRLIPMLIITFRTKMPLNIMLPMKVSNKPLFYAAAPAALLTCAIGSILSVPYYNILNYFSINIDKNRYLPKNETVLVLTLIANILIIPALNELISRGAFMQLLRQFGDAYALFVSSFFTSMLMFDIRTFPYTFFFSMIIGYFTMRTGSVATAILMRSLLSGVYYLQSFLATKLSDTVSEVSSSIFILVSLIIGLVFICRLLIVHGDKINLPLKNTYLSDFEKASYFFTCPSVILWIASSLGMVIAGLPVVH